MSYTREGTAKPGAKEALPEETKNWSHTYQLVTNVHVLERAHFTQNPLAYQIPVFILEYQSDEGKAVEFDLI